MIVRFVSGSGSSLVFVVADEKTAKSLAKSLEAKGRGKAFAVKSVKGR